MQCVRCKTELTPDSKFCGVCGGPVVDPDASEPATAGPGTTGDAEAPMVSFGEAISLGFKRYADFSGRSTRAEYWWWLLFTIITAIGLGVIDGALAGAQDNTFFSFAPLSTLFRLGTLIPSIAVGVRRLHDINRTGWWVLFCFLGYIALVIPGVVITILLVIWACKRGDEGENKHGPDPRQALAG